MFVFKAAKVMEFTLSGQGLAKSVKFLFLAIESNSNICQEKTGVLT